MLAAVSLRLLYLIFQQVLPLVLLLGRTTSTKDVELLVLPTTTPHGRIGRCGCDRRARHRRFPSRSMAGSGVDRSWRPPQRARGGSL